MGVKIIAETAFSHEGDFDYLLRQIDAAHKAQADIVKFQIFLSPATYYVPEHPALETIGKFVFSVAQWKQALEHAAALGIEVLALPLEKEALEFCMNHAALVHYIELHSVCLNEVQMLEALKRWEGKVVLGVGGYTLEEIKFALGYLDEKRTVLMLGFQSFPTDKSKLNLSKISTLAPTFACEIGYADHTDHADASFHEVNDLAMALGTTYFEKHLVLTKGEKRVDYDSAIGVEDFLEMRNRLILAKTILGDGNLDYLNEKELAYRDRRKKIVALVDLFKGTKLSREHITYRISTQPSDWLPMQYDQLLGQIIVKDVKAGSSLLKEHFEDK